MAVTAALVTAAGLAVTGCQSDDATPSASGSGADPAQPAAATPDPVRLVSSLGKGAKDVAIDDPVRISAKGGTLTSVVVSSSEGRLAGGLSPDHMRWTATGRLEPGTTYVVKTVAERSDGKVVRRTSRFHTEDLTLDQQTYPSVAPLDGETVGVGMPVIVNFDVPVTDKASFEKHMTVTTTPKQAGAWHWMSDTEAHWRPKSYWKAGSDVHVDVDVNSVPAGNGIFGQESRTLDFHIGDAHVYKVDAQTHQMKVFSNGKLLRTLPTTMGKPGFTTRSGTKVIIEKFRRKRMDAATTGISKDDPEYYNLSNVEYAMRVTYSGEFLHAAPWSVADQGHANVSHGCTGMSTANADWLYHMTLRGDVVDYTGSDRQMEPTTGYGDWNIPWDEYKQGSALS
jgi:lipoprotein-anchoring transpeptidase ErfK/SrfK